MVTTKNNKVFGNLLLTFFISSFGLQMYAAEPARCTEAAPAASQATEILSLGAFIRDTRELAKLREQVGRTIKKKLITMLRGSSWSRTLLHNAGINPDKIDEMVKVVKVIPIAEPHYTHLYLGSVPTKSENCIIEQIKETIGLLGGNLLRRSDVRVTSTAPIRLLSNFIVMEIPVNPAWYQFTQILNQSIEENCGIKLSHFVTYQKGTEWIPHITLHKIVVVDERAKTPPLDIREFLNQVGPVTGLTNSAVLAQELVGIPIAPNILPINLENLFLTKKTGRDIERIAEFNLETSGLGSVGTRAKASALASETPAGAAAAAAAGYPARPVSAVPAPAYRVETKATREPVYAAATMPASAASVTPAVPTPSYALPSSLYSGSSGAAARAATPAKIVAPAAAAFAPAKKVAQIKFSSTFGTPYYALSNQYDGAPGADPLIPGGIRGYNKKTGLLINYVWKTSEEMYQEFKRDGLPRDEAMKDALEFKFGDRRQLHDLLLSTDEAELINNTTHPYWGVGPDGKGPNNLGKMLMRLRDKIRSEL